MVISLYVYIVWLEVERKEVSTKNGNSNKVLPMHVEKAADTLLESAYGLHAIVIYSDSIMLRELLSFYTKKSIEECNELVCLAPFYETSEIIRKVLSEGHLSIDIKKYEREKESLIIVDALEKYLGMNGRTFDKESALKENQDLIKYATDMNKDGVSIFGDLGAFLFKNQIQNLVTYESSLPIRFDNKFKGICLYHQKDFEKLPEEYKEKIIQHHQIAIQI